MDHPLQDLERYTEERNGLVGLWIFTRLVGLLKSNNRGTSPNLWDLTPTKLDKKEYSQIDVSLLWYITNSGQMLSQACDLAAFSLLMAMASSLVVRSSYQHPGSAHSLGPARQ